MKFFLIVEKKTHRFQAAMQYDSRGIFKNIPQIIVVVGRR